MKEPLKGQKERDGVRVRKQKWGIFLGGGFCARFYI